MAVKVHLVLREARAKDGRESPAPKKALSPLKVREAADATLGPVPRAGAVSAFLCDRKEPQGRP